MSTEDAQLLLEVRTVQSAAVRTLVECLKELLTDASLDIDETGLKLVAMDTSRVVLVHLRLDAARFEAFHCPSKLSIGVNFLNMHKILRCVSASDVLTLFMDSPNYLSIRVQNDKNKTVYRLNLLDLDNHKLSVSPATFAGCITLPSTDLQKIVRDMHNLGAAHVEIKSYRNQLILSARGEFCAQETVLHDSGSSEDVESTDEIVQGVFSLKHLAIFCKTAPLSAQAEVYLRSDFPLIYRTNVASLGELKLCLAPQTQAAGCDG
jgi:proliferating cell nuclear antigen